jgi:hypothetical protein
VFELGAQRRRKDRSKIASYLNNKLISS